MTVQAGELPDGKLQVELRGLDVYDPTSGEIRSSSTDDIACWFIDSGYNEESFFVRHAYFTGADEPYKKLQRALKAGIDEDARASLYSTVSRPFDPPSMDPNTIDCFRIHCDEQGRSAVDMHLTRFLDQVGVRVTGYEQARELVAGRARRTAAAAGPFAIAAGAPRCVGQPRHRDPANGPNVNGTRPL